MLRNKTNCIIFDSCNHLFPTLESGFKLSKETGEGIILVAKCENESDLKVFIEPLKGQFRVRLFIEFELNDKIRRHPNFLLELDYANKRAEVISFESNLYPPLKLSAYTIVNETKYVNSVAKRDLRTLCENWCKQLNELNYKLQWEEKKQTA
jgi:hypothetical protein